MAKIFPWEPVSLRPTNLAIRPLCLITSHNVTCACHHPPVVPRRVRRVLLHSAATRDGGTRALKLAPAGSRRRKVALRSIFVTRFADTTYSSGPSVFAEQDKILPQFFLRRGTRRLRWSSRFCVDYRSKGFGAISVQENAQVSSVPVDNEL